MKIFSGALLFLYDQELWDDDGKLREEELTDLLEAPYGPGGIPAPAFCIRRTRITEPENGIIWSLRTGLPLRTIWGLWRETIKPLELPWEMAEMGLSFAVMREKGYPLQSVNHTFYPEERVAINRNSRQKETAERFVTFLLSEQIQGEDVEDGFPVTRAGVEQDGSSGK